MKETCDRQAECGGSAIWWITGLAAGIGAAALIFGRRALQHAKPTAEQIVMKAESLVSKLEHSLPDKTVA